MPAEPTSTHRHAYVARINRVVDYIDTHIDQGLDLATLAEVAHFSPWHFHRLFLAMTGETLADCVRRHRLEAAARRRSFAMIRATGRGANPPWTKDPR